MPFAISVNSMAQKSSAAKTAVCIRQMDCNYASPCVVLDSTTANSSSTVRRRATMKMSFYAFLTGV
jgi:hypothetical protein